MRTKLGSNPFAIAALASVLLLGAACGDDRSATPPAAQSGSGTGALSITFRTLDTPQSGENKVEAVVKQADGKPVTDANVAVTFRMPAMPSMNMPEMHTTTELSHSGDGRYVGTSKLSMAGTWNVTVTVSRDGAQIGSSRSSVIAK
jgi:nitrogen fixation protein FixH